MTLIKSRQKLESRWKPGDLLTPMEAAELLGYKSSKKFTDAARRLDLQLEFKRLGLTLTGDLVFGGSLRFLRSEIDAYISAKVAAARKLSSEKLERLAA